MGHSLWRLRRSERFTCQQVLTLRSLPSSLFLTLWFIAVDRQVNFELSFHSILVEESPIIEGLCSKPEIRIDLLLIAGGFKGELTYRLDDGRVVFVGFPYLYWRLSLPNFWKISKSLLCRGKFDVKIFVRIFRVFGPKNPGNLDKKPQIPCQEIRWSLPPQRKGPIGPSFVAMNENSGT